VKIADPSWHFAMQQAISVVDCGTNLVTPQPPLSKVNVEVLMGQRAQQK
jgi:hypothetical protein